MIEARGAKYAYVYAVSARFVDRANHIHVFHAMVFDVADSDDEACGKALKIARLCYPPSLGWAGHHTIETRISGFDWVGGHHLDQIKPVDPPGV